MAQIFPFRNVDRLIPFWSRSWMLLQATPMWLPLAYFPCVTRIAVNMARSLTVENWARESAAVIVHMCKSDRNNRGKCYWMIIETRDGNVRIVLLSPFMSCRSTAFEKKAITCSRNVQYKQGICTVWSCGSSGYLSAKTHSSSLGNWAYFPSSASSSRCGNCRCME